MAADTLTSLRKLLHPYYLTNILLALSFLICRMTHPLCSWAFEDCELSYVSDPPFDRCIVSNLSFAAGDRDPLLHGHRHPLSHPEAG